MSVICIYWLNQEFERKMKMNPLEACRLTQQFSDLLSRRSVPYGAQHPEEIVWRGETPAGFQAVLPLMQVVTVAPCTLEENQSAEVALRAIRLIERDQNDQDRVVSEVVNFSESGETSFTGKLFSRFPYWYDAQQQPMNPADMLRYDKSELTIDIGRSPDHIYHGWTEPQVEARPGMRYLVEMEVNISEFARLQMGVDYWRTIGAKDIGWNKNCDETTNHCEGHLSRWFGPTEGWQTLRSPSSFQNR
jgi:hypothetical protein